MRGHPLLLLWFGRSRQLSYGSYFVRYFQLHGGDPTDTKSRVINGVANHWERDVSGPVDAVRWYHRAETGANPQLAELYFAIINAYLR
jgi:hypothetical protein